ncbi:hypothetical protein CC2G_012344 [Coprinopsis cinerea AmutBmut pab1-1]|nr:hypothetical protein CC2G_012344 [Coprinopsis cinerea AmutBmut pab1-1]
MFSFKFWSTSGKSTASAGSHLQTYRNPEYLSVDEILSYQDALSNCVSSRIRTPSQAYMLIRHALGCFDDLDNDDEDFSGDGRRFLHSSLFSRMFPSFYQRQKKALPLGALGVLKRLFN